MPSSLPPSLAPLLKQSRSWLLCLLLAHRRMDLEAQPNKIQGASKAGGITALAPYYPRSLPAVAFLEGSKCEALQQSELLGKSAPPSRLHGHSRLRPQMAVKAWGRFSFCAPPRNATVCQSPSFNEPKPPKQRNGSVAVNGAVNRHQE